MTTISRSIPTSPCSSCSLNSSRSDWFRQSVLFWSSQSERSDECTNDRYCKCHGSESFASSQMSLLSNLSPRSRNSPRSPSRVSQPKTLSSSQIPSPKPCASTPRDTKDPEIDKMSLGPDEHKRIEYDPSDLLRQVQELERCFEKSPSDSSSSTASPILTLEFPTGSSIKTNPLYNDSITIRNTCATRVDDGIENSLKNVKTENNVVIERSIPAHGNKNDDINDIEWHEHNEQDIIESIQSVQNTLMELSREIEESTSGSNSERDVTNESETTMTTTASITTATEDEYKIVPNEQLCDSIGDYTEQDKKTNKPPERDPNTILRDLLSNIKPPPPMSLPVVSDASKNPLNVDRTAENKSNKNAARSKAVSTEELLRKIDDIMEFKKDKTETLKCPQYNRDRLDSGLQSTSSESNSPFPSPDVTKRTLNQTEKVKPKPERRLSCNSNFQTGQYTIREVLNENTADSVFPDDSDFSDCSPMSTLDSARVVSASVRYRPRSRSVSNCRYQTSPRVNGEFEKERSRSVQQQRLEKDDLSTSQLQRLSDKHEAETVQKFLVLANQQKDSIPKLESISIDDLASIPTIKNALEQNRQELAQQRDRQQAFLHQLGDLLLEVVNLKEEQSVVRSKQTKALNLLKKQLDAHKKNQTQAHNDVINKVNCLDERINSNCNGNGNSTEHLLTSSKSFTADRNNLSLVSTELSMLPSQRGHIIWKISDVMKKLTRTKAGIMDGNFVSPSFLTSEYGYKMNAWLYVNGRGKMIGKYVSLYACVLVGDYDAILHWPIRPTYTLTVIDQQSDSTKRRDYVKVRRVIDIAGRGGNVISQCQGIPRPNDATKALIVGFDDFISHEELLNRRYLVDDVLFLRIEAEVN